MYGHLVIMNMVNYKIGDKKHINIPTQIPIFKAKQASVGKLHTVLIDLNDNIWTFGDNRYGQSRCLECA
jgi:alpha-tubulin suppressor-like RCC1 family protein